MSKKTETWILRHTLSSQMQQSKRVSSVSFDFATGKSKTLLITGEVTTREISPAERVMPIFLFEEHKEVARGADGIVRELRYLQKTFEIAKNPADDTDEQKKNRKTIDFLKSHYEVSYKDIHGKEQNKNIKDGAKMYYQLINIDAKETQLAENEILYNELVGEVIAMKENEELFSDLAFGLGINPVGISTDKVFNLIKSMIAKNPKSFKDFLKNDTDKVYKIVINKALRTRMPDSEFNFIVEDENKNYRMNGQLLASSYDSLILYFKENSELFEYLQRNLGFKKNENQPTSKRGYRKKSEKIAEE